LSQPVESEQFDLTSKMNPTIARTASPHADTGLYVKSRNGLRLRDLNVRRLVRRMRVAMPWLKDSDVPVCRAWAELEVLSARIYAELRDNGFLNPEGDARRLLNDYRGLRKTQLSFAMQLGMTPVARKLLQDGPSGEAFDLVAAMASAVDTVEPEQPRVGDPLEGKG
jgi:hypothetical protein